jgi:hypothetical protein
LTPSVENFFYFKKDYVVVNNNNNQHNNNNNKLNNISKNIIKTDKIDNIFEILNNNNNNVNNNNNNNFLFNIFFLLTIISDVIINSKKNINIFLSDLFEKNRFNFNSYKKFLEIEKNNYFLLHHPDYEQKNDDNDFKKKNKILLEFYFVLIGDIFVDISVDFFNSLNQLCFNNNEKNFDSFYESMIFFYCFF